MRVPGDMFADKAGNEEVAMIVTVVQAERQALTCVRGGLFQQVGPELFCEERVCEALIYQDVVEIAMSQTAPQ